MSLAAHWTAALEGKTVTFRPRGSSMAGLVPDRAEVVVAPVLAALLEPGDVVLVRVAGTIYLHKVVTVDHPRQRVQIGNNKGRVNGWASYSKVAGICVSVDGTPRPRAASKVRTAQP